MKIIKEWLNKLPKKKHAEVCGCPVCTGNYDDFIKTMDQIGQETRDIEMMIFNYYELLPGEENGKEARLMPAQTLVRILTALGDINARLLIKAEEVVGEEYKKEWLKGFDLTLAELRGEK